MSTQSNQPNPSAGTTAANFCQNCGRPLTPETVRAVGNTVLCEPCLAQRMGVPLPGQPPMSGAMPHGPVRNSPGLAALLGFIPGVGAMYNGQVAKGLVHVVIFIALVSVTDHFGPFGMLVAAWIFYQVFDAYQTAHALRMGMPLPDHLGLNNIGARMGFGTGVSYPVSQAPVYPPAVPPAPGYPAGYPASYPATYPVPPAGEYVPPPPAPGYAPADPAAPVASVAGEPGFPGPLDEPTHRSVPVGAIVLVALGVVFLLGTAGVLSMHWVFRGWPLILIVLGVFLFIRNNRSHGGAR